MAIFNIFKRAPEWEDLSVTQRTEVTKRIISGINRLQRVKAQSGAAYKVVSGFNEFQRE